MQKESNMMLGVLQLTEETILHDIQKAKDEFPDYDYWLVGVISNITLLQGITIIASKYCCSRTVEYMTHRIDILEKIYKETKEELSKETEKRSTQ